MLSRPASAQDACFPNLGLALDADAAGAALARALRDQGFPSAGLTAQIERIRLKSGRKALIAYKLQGRDAAGKSFDQRLMLILWPFAKAANLPDMGGPASAAPQFGPAFMDVRELGGEAWLFPNDRKIHQLPALLEMARELGGEPQVIHYVPEQGCTVRCEIDGEVHYGKVRADDRGAVAARVHRAAAPALNGKVRLAPIVSYDTAKRIQWQKAVAGSPVDLAQISGDLPFWAGEMAAALSAFHALPAPEGLKILGTQSVCRTVIKRIERISAALPELSNRLARIASWLEDVCPGELPVHLSHGDLHPANLLWDGESFALIDLDTCALAPPALDQGSLAAALAAKAVQAGWRQAQAGELADVLRDSFAAETGDANPFEWFFAASLIGERLYRSTTRLKWTDPEVRLALLELAEARLGKLEHRRAG